MTKKAHKFCIGKTRKQTVPDMEATLRKFAHNFMVTEKKLTPLIKAKHIPPNEAIVLIAAYTDAAMMGHEHDSEHRMSEDDIIGASNLLIMLWKKGLFTPSSEYPYTLQQTLATGGESEAQE